MLRPSHRPVAALGMSEPRSGGSHMWRVAGKREEAVAVGSDESQLEPGSLSQGSGCGDGGLMFGGVGGLWPVSEEMMSGGAGLRAPKNSQEPAEPRERCTW